MRSALVLARRGLGRVWPNPAVGCVLVAGGHTGRRIVGRGVTQPGGRPHAEAIALERAGRAARGAVAYVTLEPCAHDRAGGSCCAALIEAGIGRAVIACEDPDPRTNGQGVARLRAAGIPVTVGLLGEEAAALNEGFFRRVRDGRPMITLKLATSLDGRIAAPSGDSRWITGEEARARGHLLRASHDAILAGSATALADDPSLTCRLPGLEDRSPVRVIADRRLRLSPDALVIRTARQTPTWVLTSPDADAQRRRALEAAGAEVVTLAGAPPDAAAMAAALAARGITRLLIEGGGEIAAAFLAAGLVDRLAWFTAPRILGGDATPAVAALALQRVSDAPTFAVLGRGCFGDDFLTDGTRRSQDIR
ncbi:MAG: bifunctional diaminohydroxyphosphoribosylaminopyrimidine deaminase/5-amino-6-(5-phosphoribosylamino)uracil reductase RibD [Rhodospirillales bacterium]|nr:bifunctional diaminohydroxyphosphoribosylaminopyrimidine deaminase/5-amino-6-(5-phosphoribosylamino)uracil reductase RibD [Rhodospirillales bacterium]